MTDICLFVTGLEELDLTAYLLWSPLALPPTLGVTIGLRQMYSMGRKREKSDQEILDAARKCFLQHGPGLATGVIARELGVSQATLFNRFNTKRELMIAALGPPDKSPALELLKKGPDMRPIPVQLRDISYELMQFYRECDPCQAVLKAAGVSHEEVVGQAINSSDSKGVSSLREWLQKASTSGRIAQIDANAIATAFVSTIKGGLDLFPAEQTEGLNRALNLSEQTFLDSVVDLYWSALDPARTVS